MPEPRDQQSSPPWRNSEWVVWTQELLNSYRRFVGSDLIARENPERDSQQLFQVPFVVVSHGTETDPLLNYGNEAALALWQMPLARFLGTPSRQTAEPVHRDERADLLRRTREHGFIDDYSGIRITSTGVRFKIHRATVWNVVNDQNAYIGQAAAFSEWTMMPD